jgi:hypothetical protein
MARAVPRARRWRCSLSLNLLGLDRRPGVAFSGHGVFFVFRQTPPGGRQDGLRTACQSPGTSSSCADQIKQTLPFANLEGAAAKAPFTAGQAGGAIGGWGGTGPAAMEQGVEE